MFAECHLSTEPTAIFQMTVNSAKSVVIEKSMAGFLIVQNVK